MNGEVFCLDPAFSTTRCVTRVPSPSRDAPGSKIHSVLFLPPRAARKGEGGLRMQGFFKKGGRFHGAAGTAEGDGASLEPLVTVITVVFNGMQTLEQTILSVIRQSYSNVEYIIVDGGSTDGTLDIIRQYEHAIDYWVSEPDRGISDAFNKGIAMSSGGIIGIIGADDWYELDAVGIVVERMITHRADIAHGKIQYWDSGGRLESVAGDDSRLFLDMTVNHPTVFVLRDLYERLGLFRPEFRYAMDYELLLRAKTNGAGFVYLDRCVTNMRTGGASDRNWRAASREVADAKATYLPASAMHFLYYVFQVCKGTTRGILKHLGLQSVVSFYHKHFSLVKKTSAKDRS